MPRNPNKAPCTHPGCRAWAVRAPSPGASAEPLCAAHGGRNPCPEPRRGACPEPRRGACPEPRRGAPLGNQNARTHGFYASILKPEELADLDTTGQLDGNTTLDAEIDITRIALRRLLHMLDTGTTPAPNPQPLTAQDYATLIGLAFRGCGTLSRLLRARKDLDAGQLSRLQRIFGKALDELSEEWGRQL